MPANSALPFRTSRMESNEDQEKEDIREEIRQVEYNIALLKDEMKKGEDREKTGVRNHRKELASIQKNIKKYEKLTKTSQEKCELLKNKQRKLWETCWKKWTPQQKESAKQIQKEEKKAQEYRKKISNLHEQIRRLQEAKEGSIKPWRLCKVCEKEYTRRIKHSPRVLGCGHTICYSCCFKMATPFGIECPFDRILTPTPKTMLRKMPMNLTLLHM